MSVAIGDIIAMTVTKVSKYACWGTFKGQTGFVHCVDWSRKRPIPESNCPQVGKEMTVKVFKLVTEQQSQLPTDVTFDGTISVDFAASAAPLEPI
jgi:ribosomal protein S1